MTSCSENGAMRGCGAHRCALALLGLRPGTCPRRMMMARALGLIARTANRRVSSTPKTCDATHGKSLSLTRGPVVRPGRNVRSNLRSAIGPFSGPC
jgi:hypothetical protein